MFLSIYMQCHLCFLCNEGISMKSWDVLHTTYIFLFGISHKYQLSKCKISKPWGSVGCGRCSDHASCELQSCVYPKFLGFPRVLESQVLPKKLPSTPR